MKLSIVIVLVTLFILVSGFQNPALFFIGYLWTSILYPTAFATTVLPLSLTFGVLCLIGYFFIDKRRQGQLPAIFHLSLLFALWLTLTTTWAALPEAAWFKWRWAIPAVIIPIASPLFLRTRAQIETAFIAVFAALAAHVMTGGIKSILGTGGYSQLGVLMEGNVWLGETSTLALACVISLPMGYYCINHSAIFEQYRGRWARIGFALYAVLAIMCMIGTSARTGVLALATLLLFGIKGAFRKAAAILCAVAVYSVAQPYLPEKSIARFATIATYDEDSSATVRLAVWQWAISYAEQHPFGGGFGIFDANNFEYQVRGPHGETITGTEQGRAAHSVFFEVLGEHGYPGIVLYLALILNGIWGSRRMSRSQRADTQTQWAAAFARTLFICMTVFAAGGAFIGIAFQPLLYVLLGFQGSIARWACAQQVTLPKFGAIPALFRRVPDESRA